ncbi:MAG: hypothetical protein KJP23_28690, partial [Deltaproteobacteria bacterium]|nr:hypothetical protein [Deltaproteobacteria bacterium]
RQTPPLWGEIKAWSSGPGFFTLCGLARLAIRRYAVAISEFHRISPIDSAVIRSMTRRRRRTPVISAAAVGLSFLNVHLGTYAFLAIPLFYLSYCTVDTRLKKPEDASA